MVAATTAGAVVDVRTRRIPNLVTAALLVAALVTRAALGAPQLLDGFAAAMLVFVVGFPVAALRIFGAGDVKLLAGCAAVVGFAGLLPLCVDVAIAGALLAIGEAMRRRNLVLLAASTFGIFSGRAATARIGLPYGVAIAGGSIVFTVTALAAAH